MPYGTTRNFHRLLILFSSLSILTVLSSGVFYLFYRVVLACCWFKVIIDTVLVDIFQIGLQSVYDCYYTDVDRGIYTVS